MPPTCPDCASAGVDTGTTQDSTTAGAAAASCEIGEIADAGLDRTVDVADDAGGARHGRHFHRAIEPARLGGVDRHDLRGPLLDDLDHIVRIPGALVSHHRRVDGASDLGEPLDAFDRLLEIDQIVLLHAAERLDCLARRLVALVGVAAQRDAGSHRLADAPHHLDIAVGIDTDLDLDGADALSWRPVRPRARPPRSRAARSNA